MRHRNKKAILNRPADQRHALIRNLLTSLFESGAIQTTDRKAKALVNEAGNLIGLIKRQKENFNKIRELKKILYTESACKKALEYIEKTPHTSGAVRAVKIRMRPGDGAVITQVELIEGKK